MDLIYGSIDLGLGVIAGAIVGWAYFTTLWATVRRLPRSRRPAVFMTGSFLVRTAAAVLVIFWVSQGIWQRFIGCLIGFIIVRATAVRRVRSSGAK